MKKRTIVIVLSLMFAMLIMSNGYGYWNETLTIRGSIEIRPNQEEMETMLQQLQLMKQEVDKPTEEPVTEDNAANEAEPAGEQEKENIEEIRYDEENQDEVIGEGLYKEDTGESEENESNQLDDID